MDLSSLGPCCIHFAHRVELKGWRSKSCVAVLELVKAFPVLDGPADTAGRRGLKGNLVIDAIPGLAICNIPFIIVGDIPAFGIVGRKTSRETSEGVHRRLTNPIGVAVGISLQHQPVLP